MTLTTTATAVRLFMARIQIIPKQARKTMCKGILVLGSRILERRLDDYRGKVLAKISKMTCILLPGPQECQILNLLIFPRV
jgi:hypothetical protein